MKDLGDGLQLGGWTRNGIGDLTLMIEWFRDFPQAKPTLKVVRINWWAGISSPTGLRHDPDKIMAVPFGYNGSFSIPFGMGLDLHFIHHLKAGFYVQLTHAFGSTQSGRIKTDPDQTELLLLTKTSVYTDPGLTQQFSLFGEVYKPWGGLSCMLAYQYIKQNRSTIALYGNTYAADIANTAQYLRDWTMHQLFVRADYDIGDHMGTNARVFPRITLYTRIPFNGKRFVANSTIGAIFSLDF